MPPTEQGPHPTHSTFVVLENKTETSFKMNFLPMKGENPITSYCVVLMFKSAKMQWLVKEILVFWSIGYTFHGWWQRVWSCWLGQRMDVWFWINWWGGEWNCIRKWWQHCNVNCRNFSIFISFFLSHPNLAPLSPNTQKYLPGMKRVNLSHTAVKPRLTQGLLSDYHCWSLRFHQYS